MKIVKQKYPTQKGIALLELLLFLGLAVALVFLFLNTPGGNPGGGPLPGSDPFVSNITQAENMIGQLGTNTPGPVSCQFLRNSLGFAIQGLSNMQASGASDAVVIASQKRIDTLITYIESNCPA